MKKGFTRLSGFLLAILLVIPVYSSAGDSNEILLKSRSFVPERGITAAAKATIEASPDRAHVLIQLEQIPTIKQREELEAEGIKLLSYIPNKAWLASIPSGKAGEIAALSNVRAISEILPEDKISPHITAGELFEQRVRDGKADFIVEFFKDVSFAEADEVIQRHNGRIVGRVPSLNAVVAVIQVEESIYLGFEESVKWIEQELPLEPVNDGSRAAIGVDTVQAPPYNLNGNNIGVLVYDDGSVDEAHSDFGGRVIRADGGDRTDHATHVAGTVGGDGSRSEACEGTPLQWRGMAPAVDIISYNVYGSCDYWIEPPECLYADSGEMADMENNFNYGIANYGADIGTASVAAQPALWGIDCKYEGDYSPHARLIDTIIYNKSIPITWAAGNERFNGWCGYDYNTISPTATGKNAIIVGAINSEDDSMTSFSSWGPTDDGRIKPDVVAPGCGGGEDLGITSTGLDNTYYAACGTSSATPAVAGSVALLLEDWRNTHRGNPLPSTMKAILIQTAVDLGNPGPDYSYGYGKINVKDAIDLIDVVVEDSIIDQNDKDYFTINVPGDQPVLKITLVWDDYPAEALAAETLVNDLNLIVKDPNGKRYYPWILDPNNPSVAATRGEDHRNNVEQVCVDTPFSGTWTIEVNATRLPQPVQKYSLVWNPKFLNLRKVDDINDGNGVVPGDYITYTISYPVIFVCGDPNYNNAVITDFLPDDLVFISASGPNSVYHPAARTVTWNIGTNEPGSVTLTVKANDCITEYGIIKNYCTIKGGAWTLGKACENTPVLCASCPTPTCGELSDFLCTGDPCLNLTWCPGHFAADINGHEVYFGTNYDDVRDAVNSWPIGEVYKGIVSNPTYPIEANKIELGTTHYWRIDEVKDSNVWKGSVWSFTADCYLVENFNRYVSTGSPPSPALRDTWKDWYTQSAPVTSAEVSTEQTTVRSGLKWGGLSGQSMKYWYRNNLTPFYSEARANIANTAAPPNRNGLGIDPNWLGLGATVLSLWFYGQPGNDANKPMYVTLTDGASNSAKIIYYGDMNDIRNEEWHQWNIVLQDFVDDNDVNLANVSKIVIGFGNGTQAASDGTVYFEDIRLYLNKRCFPGCYPVGDFKPDCIVDFYDFAILAQAWLTSSEQPDYNPVCDISVPHNGKIDGNDLARFCEDWLLQAVGETSMSAGFTELLYASPPPKQPQIELQPEPEPQLQVQSEPELLQPEPQPEPELQPEPQPELQPEQQQSMLAGPNETPGIWLVYDGNMTPNSGDEITVYIHADPMLLCMGIIVEVAGDANITTAMSEADCNNYGWDNGWNSDPYIDPSGWLFITGVSWESVVNGTVGYFKFRYNTGEVTVSITEESCAYDAYCQPVLFSPQPLIFGDPNQN